MHIGENLSKVGALANKFCFSQLQLGLWVCRDTRNILHLLPDLETVFPALKLIQNCYVNMNICFSWKLASQSWIGSPSLFYKHTVPERLSSQSNKIWNQWDFKNSNFSTSAWIGKKLEFQLEQHSNLIGKWEKLGSKA